MKQRGFSLIELMITIAIVGILAAVALPTYWTFVKNSRQDDVRVCAATAMPVETEYFTEYKTYKPSTDLKTDFGLGCVDDDVIKDYYDLSAGNCDGHADTSKCIRITAKPKAGVASSDYATYWIESDGEVSSNWND